MTSTTKTTDAVNPTSTFPFPPRSNFSSNYDQRDTRYPPTILRQQAAASTTFHLLKKLTSGIPRVATSFFGSIAQEFNYWEDFNFFGALEDVTNTQTSAATDLEFALGSTISELFFPFINSSLKLLLSLDLGEEFEYDHPVKMGSLEKIAKTSSRNGSHGDHASSVSDLSDTSDLSTCDAILNCNSGEKLESLDGIPFRSPDFIMNESHQRLDYIITQIDISRMTRTASRRLDVESINRLPTIIYHKHDPLICPSYEGGDIEDYLRDGDVPLIEDYFKDIAENEDGSTAEGQDSKLKENIPNFSWMVVPSNPMREDVTRMSSSILLPGEVPESISICNSCHSKEILDEKRSDPDSTYENCVICQEPFQDGENLRVLPCQHLFHCGCIDKWLLGETYPDERSTQGCPMCKKKPVTLSSPQQASHRNGCVQDSPAETHHSDGSVPSWAFARLGDILSSVNDENHFARNLSSV